MFNVSELKKIIKKSIKSGFFVYDKEDGCIFSGYLYINIKDNQKAIKVVEEIGGTSESFYTDMYGKIIQDTETVKARKKVVDNIIEEENKSGGRFFVEDTGYLKSLDKVNLRVFIDEDKFIYVNDELSRVFLSWGKLSIRSGKKLSSPLKFYDSDNKKMIGFVMPYRYKDDNYKIVGVNK